MTTINGITYRTLITIKMMMVLSILHAHFSSFIAAFGILLQFLLDVDAFGPEYIFMFYLAEDYAVQG